MTENLRETIKSHYRTGISDLGKDFFSPCLSLCTEYFRSTGFFSSSALITWAEALPRITESDDIKIQLLISPCLSEDDKSALKKIIDPIDKEKYYQILVDQILVDVIEFTKNPSAPENKVRRIKILIWLIANNKLEIRFAKPSGQETDGMFHEKIGIFKYPSGDSIAFTGSANETLSGHKRNYESIDVYRSWIASETERVEIKLEQFIEAWRGNAPGLEVLTLSKKVMKLIKSYSPQSMPIDEETPPLTGATPEQPDNKWRHQDEAVSKFLLAKQGILEMATGTGKTRTAIKIITQLIKEKKINSVIITTDGVDLLDQWRKEIDSWNLKNSFNYTVLRQYEKNHEMNFFSSNPENSAIIISRGALKDLFKQLPINKRNSIAIIHDEVHGLGSPSHCKNLAGEHHQFGYRLGLSATPEREYDEEGNKFLSDEIGETIYTFKIEDAIQRGILCEFDYVALEYELTQNDKKRLQKVHSREAARRKSGNPMTRQEVWIELSKVYKTAEQKPAVFQNHIRDKNELLKSTIVFVETKEYGNKILPIIHTETSKYRTYYGDDDRSHLIEFSNGRIDCLITCHRISQGIDIKNLKNVILFSAARAKLETIQRIGRCLRTDPNNSSKRATIIDFVQGINEEKAHNTDKERYEWLSALSKTKRTE
ncbi:DEAD/DEAH box helicase family protein [Desulfovibrio ferrophilus]|uniref:Helicase-like protein n=1 Tax=Desulfovibrio ferrophilus TaxID=241368 RepID=A0A2Z6AYT7_9BACT|nr:DEAD/DEAH box helicase family protein [Desulfovibrio ferrophilus]BBD08431.1 helicase-like protein [Desulfovibrio ferrophilus]